MQILGRFDKNNTMITKEKLLETIKSIPEEKFRNIDEVLEEIVLIEKIEISLAAAKKGEVLTEEETDREISTW